MDGNQYEAIFLNYFRGIFPNADNLNVKCVKRMSEQQVSFVIKFHCHLQDFGKKTQLLWGVYTFSV